MKYLLVLLIFMGGVCMAENVTIPHSSPPSMFQDENGCLTFEYNPPEEWLHATTDKKKCTLCNGTGLKEAGWEKKKKGH